MNTQSLSGILLFSAVAAVTLNSFHEEAQATTPQQNMLTPELASFRTRLDGRLDLIRGKLEARILALDTANPRTAVVEAAGRRMLDAWTELDEMLPDMTPEALEGVRVVFAHAGSMRGLDWQPTERGDEGGGVPSNPEGICAGYEGGQFAGVLGDLVSDLIADLASGLDDADEDEPGELGDLQSNGIPNLYPPGVRGEEVCGQAQVVLETLTDLSPSISVSVGIIFVDVGVEIPSPLTIIFAVLALFNEFECLEAAADNAINDNCEADNLAMAVASLSTQLTGAQTAIQNQVSSAQTAIQSQVTNAQTAIQNQVSSAQTAIQTQITNFEGSVGDQFGVVMGQAEDIRVQNCEQIRLLHTPQGRRTSIIDTCGDQADWPYEW